MKILFVVGGLEPGANGVGDYSRLLAKEVIRQGDYQCALLALNDPFVSNSVVGTIDDAIRQMRLSSTLSWKQRVEIAKDFVDEFSPDWMSIQFVSYSFNPRGIVKGLVSQLKKLTEGRGVHFMFHELWIGENRECSCKERMIGLIQRYYIVQTIRQLQPDVVSTSNSVYLAILSKHKIRAGLLPLFGNIPVCTPSPAESQVFETMWRQIDRTQKEHNGKQEWTGIFFGALHPQWKAEPLLSSLCESARQKHCNLRLVAIGRLGEAGKEMWQAMSESYSFEIVFSQLGEQPSSQISLAFQKADFGVAATDWQRIEKSGSAAAMLDHGLPVIVNLDDWHWRENTPVVPPSNPSLQYFDGTKPSLLMNLQKRVLQASLPTVAKEFLSQLHVGRPNN